MKWCNFLILCSMFIFSGCSLRQREMELDKKMTEINEREQQLTLKEQSLDIREHQLDVREKLLDSTTRKSSVDSLYALHPGIPGTWNVKMECKETTCPGSAVGDIKNEQWIINFLGNVVIATARSNDQLIRVYSGAYINSSIRLAVRQDSADKQFSKMVVNLTQTKDDEMTGEREITQASGCHIVYSLQLKKQ